jgi:hypothetical protein
MWAGALHLTAQTRDDVIPFQSIAIGGNEAGIAP